MSEKSPLAEKVTILLQLFQLLAIILGGGWFLIQYHQTTVNQQRQESLKYAAKAYEIHITEDLAYMGKPFQDPEIKNELVSARDKSIKSADICPINSFYGTRLIPLYYSSLEGSDKFFKSLNELMVFYTSLSICVKSDVCDLETACNFFFYDAKGFTTRHCTYFDRAKIANGYSPVEDIQYFLKRCTNIEIFQVPTESYCDLILKASGKQLDNLYKSCAD